MYKQAAVIWAFPSPVVRDSSLRGCLWSGVVFSLTSPSIILQSFSLHFHHIGLPVQLFSHVWRSGRDGEQHTNLPCPSPTPGACSNSCPLSWWCHPTVSSSVVPFSSCLRSFPASGSFQMSELFASGGQTIGVSVSTSVFPMNIQDCFPLGWTGWIFLQSKGLSRVFSNTTVEKHQFFGTQLSL